MPDAIKDIERPLGQDPGGPRAPARNWNLKRGSIVAAVAVVALVGVSGAIALREPAFRKPQAVTTTPKVTVPAETAPAPQQPAAPKVETTSKPGGPQIIHLQPDPAQSGTGGGIVIHDPSAVSQDLRVAHLPDKALIEQSETGPLPIRAADGRRPFDVYALSWSGARGGSAGRAASRS